MSIFMSTARDTIQWFNVQIASHANKHILSTHNPHILWECIIKDLMLEEKRAAPWQHWLPMEMLAQISLRSEQEQCYHTIHDTTQLLSNEFSSTGK